MSSTGLSSSGLRQMHEVMHGYVERGEVPGVVTLVSRHGEVHVDCIGYPRDTIFRMGSMTKAVTAAGAMVLVDEGVIRLDDPIGNLLPELSEPRVLRAIDSSLDDTVPINRAITVLDLLTFTLGTGMFIAEPGTYPIQEAFEQDGFRPFTGGRLAADEYLRQLAGIPLVHQPGEVWMYNTGSDVLGILVQRATGRSLGAFLRERIFEPLGMKDTGFTVPASHHDRLPAAYFQDGDGGLKIEDGAGADSEFSRPHALEWGAGGLVSTIDDWFVFVSMLLNLGSAGSTQILSKSAVETMTIDHLTPEQKARTTWLPGWFDTRGWGFGVGVTTRRYDLTSTPGKYGWEGGYGTSWYNDPREQLITVALTQLGAFPHPVVRDFWTLAYAALE